MFLLIRVVSMLNMVISGILVLVGKPALGIWLILTTILMGVFGILDEIS